MICLGGNREPPEGFGIRLARDCGYRVRSFSISFQSRAPLGRTRLTRGWLAISARAASSPAASASKPHSTAAGTRASSQLGRYRQAPAVETWTAAGASLPMDMADSASMALSARKTTGSVTVASFRIWNPPSALRLLLRATFRLLSP